MTAQRRRVVVGTIVGGLVGFAFGAGIYLALVPLLESAEGPVRELQGFAWNLVPFGTIGGGLLGWAFARRDGTSGGHR